jgi:2-C-methyl-D-erythritol 2,4-cyclodiphosphate synthase
MRIGLGFDAHRSDAGGALVLGTVAVEHERGLEGHSDGDVLAHAIVDALLGAAGLGDIGTHFPSSDPRWLRAESALFLREVAGLLRVAGLRVSNVDATVICERPRIEPYREKMQSAIAAAIDAPSDRVGVKATTTDGMGFTGRGEGIAAIAVALLESSPEA